MKQFVGVFLSLVLVLALMIGAWGEGLVIEGEATGKSQTQETIVRAFDTFTIGNKDTEFTSKTDTDTCHKAENINNPVANSILSVSQLDISIPFGETASVIVTFLDRGTVKWTAADPSIATCTWANNWNGDDIALRSPPKSAPCPLPTPPRPCGG